MLIFKLFVNFKRVIIDVNQGNIYIVYCLETQVMLIICFNIVYCLEAQVMLIICLYLNWLVVLNFSTGYQHEPSRLPNSVGRVMCMYHKMYHIVVQCGTLLCTTKLWYIVEHYGIL